MEKDNAEQVWAVNIIQGGAHPNEAQPARSDEATLVWHLAQPHHIFYLSTVMALLSQGASINKYAVTHMYTHRNTHARTNVHIFPSFLRLSFKRIIPPPTHSTHETHTSTSWNRHIDVI